MASILLDGSIAIQLSCPGNKVVSTDANLCTAIVNDIDAIFTPSGSTAAYTFTLTGATIEEGEGSASGKIFKKGVTTVTYTLANDNTKTCSFTVTVEDKEKPAVVTQNILVQLDANGTASITPEQVNNGSGDNCTAANDLQLSLNNTVFGCNNVGPNTVTLTVTDASGNAQTGTATVTVEDKVKPTIIAPAAISVNNDPGQCYATVNLGNPVTDDNCGVQGVSNDAPVNFPVGTTTVTWTVTDIW